MTEQGSERERECKSCRRYTAEVVPDLVGQLEALSEENERLREFGGVQSLRDRIEELEGREKTLRDAYHKLSSAYTSLAQGWPSATPLRLEAGQLYRTASEASPREEQP